MKRFIQGGALVIAVNLPPGKTLSPALGAFLDSVRSPPWQQVAAKAGYVLL